MSHRHRMVHCISPKWGLTSKLRCVDDAGADVEWPENDCAVLEWFNWDVAGATDGYEGEETVLRGDAEIVVTEASEDAFTWHYAEEPAQ